MTACVTLAALGVAAVTVPPVAAASELVDRNARNVRLAVNRNGEALLTHTPKGGTRPEGKEKRYRATAIGPGVTQT